MKNLLIRFLVVSWIAIQLLPTEVVDRGQPFEPRMPNMVVSTGSNFEPAVPHEKPKVAERGAYTLSEFYSNPDLSDGFLSTQERANPHRGLDFPHASGTPIPALLGGVVVVSEWSHSLGFVVEVLQDDGRYVGYRHLLENGLPVGHRVKQSDTIGYVGNTGSTSRGSHLCTTNSSTLGGVFGEGGLADPWPYIIKYTT